VVVSVGPVLVDVAIVVVSSVPVVELVPELGSSEVELGSPVLEVVFGSPLLAVSGSPELVAVGSAAPSGQPVSVSSRGIQLRARRPVGWFIQAGYAGVSRLGKPGAARAGVNLARRGEHGRRDQALADLGVRGGVHELDVDVPAGGVVFVRTSVDVHLSSPPADADPGG
jgi:hypothetical protein